MIERRPFKDLGGADHGVDRDHPGVRERDDRRGLKPGQDLGDLLARIARGGLAGVVGRAREQDRPVGDAFGHDDDGEQLHAQLMSARDVALLLDGVAEGDAVGGSAGCQHQLDLRHRRAVEGGAEVGEELQHFGSRVGLDRVVRPDAGHRGRETFHRFHAHVTSCGRRQQNPSRVRASCGHLNHPPPCDAVKSDVLRARMDSGDCLAPSSVPGRATTGDRDRTDPVSLSVALTELVARGHSCMSAVPRPEASRGTRRTPRRVCSSISPVWSGTRPIGRSAFSGGTAVDHAPSYGHPAHDA